MLPFSADRLTSVNRRGYNLQAIDAAWVGGKLENDWRFATSEFFTKAGNRQWAPEGQQSHGHRKLLDTLVLNKSCDPRWDWS